MTNSSPDLLRLKANLAAVFILATSYLFGLVDFILYFCFGDVLEKDVKSRIAFTLVVLPISIFILNIFSSLISLAKQHEVEPPKAVISKQSFRPPKASPFRKPIASPLSVASPYKSPFKSPSTRSTQSVQKSPVVQPQSPQDTKFIQEKLQELDQEFFKKKTVAPFVPVATVSAFQPATKSKQKPKTTAQQKEGNRFIEACTVLEECKLDPFIDEWSFLVRKWFGTHLLPWIQARISSIDEAFKQAGLEDFNSTKSISLQIPELLQKYPDAPMVQDRIKLEYYLLLEDMPHSRDYCLARIKELTSSSYIASYRYNAGSQKWNHERFPSDALLLMHLFARFLDEFMGTGDFPFSNQFLVGPEPNLENSRASDFKIVCKERFPPHFCLAVGKQIWDIQSVCFV